MKLKLVILFALLSLLLAGIAAAESVKWRYLVKSDSESLGKLLGEKHRFRQGFTADLNAAEVAALKTAGVEVEEVPLRQLSGRPAPTACNPSASLPWGVQMVNGGSGGSGVKVAVLDTGVKKDHPDLAANIFLCKDATKRGITDGCKDSNGHGTHVAGTIAANGKIKGVAPDAKLIIVKVCGSSGCWLDDIADGMRYAADNGANVISMSLGGDSDHPLERDAVSYAVSKGVLVVAAAGNDGPALGSIDYPGANVDVVAVAALDSSNRVADFSSRGINDGDYAKEEREIEFAAPGVSVESTYKDGCYAVMSGTSMATPHVSGMAAKLWQGSAALTRAYLKSVAEDVTLGLEASAGDDPASGFGLPKAPLA